MCVEIVCKYLKKYRFMLFALGFSGYCTAQDSESIKIEPFQTVDGNNINLVSGKLSLGLPYIRIGAGALSLSNTIYADSERGSFDNHYDDWDGLAFIRQRCIPGSSPPCTFEWVMAARVGGVSTTFRLSTDHESPIQEQTFTPTNDPLASLEASSDGAYLYLNKGQGTIYTFGYREPAGAGYSVTYWLERVEYPNGFTVSIFDGKNGDNRFRSVVTNTGLQIKYVYDTTTGNPFHDRAIAINNAYEYCDPEAVTCDLSMNWPVATFAWPTGYPDGTDYTADTIFRITDWRGLITEYHHTQLNVYESWHDYVGPPEYKPAIKSVKNSNTAAGVASVYYAPYIKSNERSIYYSQVKRATGGEWTYIIDDMHKDSSMREFNNYSIGPDGVSALVKNILYGCPIEVTTPEGKKIFLERNEVNRVKHVIAPEGNKIRYIYDSIGRLQGKQVFPRGSQEQSDISKALITTVEYVEDEVCDEHPKACNKPRSITDPNGNVTEFASYNHIGKPELIIRPADKNGVKPMTKYSYSEKYAYIKNAAGIFVKADTPVWLLTSETTCQKGSYTTDDGCAQGDGVTTEYDYGPTAGPNNLWLRGIAITDHKSNEIRRTCFSYDKFGNRIGEYSPKAKLSSCP